MSHNYATPALARVLVVKYGGNAMAGDGDDPVLAEIADLWRAGARIVLVHGGGPEIDRALERLGIVTRRVDGLRVTDAPTLEVTEAVLCATLNKRIVRALLKLGVTAVGISGQDGNGLRAIADRSARADLGYVGTIVATDTGVLDALLDAGYLPVVAPLAVSMDSTTALNVNADLSAAAIAGSMHADALVQVTNVPGVYRNLCDPSSLIDRMSVDETAAFLISDACQSSMIPKLQAALSAVRAGTKAAYICAAATGCIQAAIGGAATVIA